MSLVRGSNTLPERLVEGFLRRHRIRFRRQDRRLPGTPDIVVPQFHVAIFVDRVFLAWLQGLPPLKTAVHEEKILGGQNPGKQETRRAGPHGSSQAGMDGGDSVGMPRQLRR
jgi:hypothetical protein